MSELRSYKDDFEKNNRQCGKAQIEPGKFPVEKGGFTASERLY